jgi:hypothetical protein
MPKRLTQTEFIKRASLKHLNAYDYRLVLYKNSYSKVKIICTSHGVFEQFPKNHLLGQGCPRCNGGEVYDQESFIKKCLQIHGTKYDYSLSKYVKSNSKVTIKCLVHGDFEQRPSDHINSLQGCPKCAGKLRKNEAQFELAAKLVHGNIYDYSSVVYLNNSTKVKIRCLKHGYFEQIPNSHLNGRGCPECGGNLIKNSETFSIAAKKVHGLKYDYSKVSYKGNKIPVKIICKKHGTFSQKPNSHLSGQGCRKCSGKEPYTEKTFVSACKKIHGKRYDYSGTVYFSSNKKVSILCRVHGPFKQTPSKHLSGQGCLKCTGLQRGTFREFVNKARKEHGRRYRYTGEYKNRNTPIEIICLKHGSFLQAPYSHLSGRGCPACNESLGERKISALLKKLRLSFKRQEKFHDCRNKLPLPFDFSIESNGERILIEYHGVQHYSAIGFFGGDKAFEQRLKNDKIKKDWAKKNGHKLIIIHYRKLNTLETYLASKLTKLTER